VARLIISAYVDDADFARFKAGDPEIEMCFDARLSEVFGDNGAHLTTIRVESVALGEGVDLEQCDHINIACIDCGGIANA